MSRRYYRQPVAHWLDLRYADTCHVCGAALPKGARAFYDPATRQVTCTELACAEANGLTREVWHGAPTSGRWVKTFSEHRIGTPALRRPPTGPGFGMSPYVKRGRCEDAPCCGCCDDGTGRQW